MNFGCRRPVAYIEFGMSIAGQEEAWKASTKALRQLSASVPLWPKYKSVHTVSCIASCAELQTKIFTIEELRGMEKKP